MKFILCIFCLLLIFFFNLKLKIFLFITMCSITCWIQICIIIKNRSVLFEMKFVLSGDRQTNKQTEGRTDWQTRIHNVLMVTRPEIWKFSFKSKNSRMNMKTQCLPNTWRSHIFLLCVLQRSLHIDPAKPFNVCL